MPKPAPFTTPEDTPEMVEEAARTWVYALIAGGDITVLERGRLQMAKRGSHLTRQDWDAIAERISEDYIGPAGLQKTFVHAAFTRVLTTAMTILDEEALEVKDRIASGRLALEAIKQLAALAGVSAATRIDVNVSIDTMTEADRMQALLAKVDQTIVEARGIEVKGLPAGTISPYDPQKLS